MMLFLFLSNSIPKSLHGQNKAGVCGELQLGAKCQHRGVSEVDRHASMTVTPARQRDRAWERWQ